MLSNRACIGEAIHTGDGYPGEHDAIIDRETWDRVHTTLQESPRTRTARTFGTSGGRSFSMVSTASRISRTQKRTSVRLFFAEPLS